MINTLTAIVLSSTLAHAQDEEWRIEKDRTGQYLCSSGQFQWGFARKAIGEQRIALSRYEREDDICFLIPKKLIATTTKEEKLTIETGYNTERRYGYEAKPLSTWSVEVYTYDGAVSLRSRAWEIREEEVGWQRRLRKTAESETEIVEIPPHIEYQLCVARAVDRVEVTYQRPDKQVDYIILKKSTDDKLEQVTCFEIDPLLVGRDGVFTVRGQYAPTNPYTEPESISPFPVFTTNGFVALQLLPNDVKAQPNHYYSKTPPTNVCKNGTNDHVTLHFEDRDAKHMQAYAVLREKEIQLEFVGNASPQQASFYVPSYVVNGYGFTVYAKDAQENKSKELALENIPPCE